MIAPDEEGYEFHDYFFFHTTTGEMKPHPSASVESQEHAQLTISCYDLDNAERRKLRRREARNWNLRGHEELDDHAYRDFLESSSLA